MSERNDGACRLLLCLLLLFAVPSIPFVLIESGDTATLFGLHRSARWVESVSFNIIRIDEETLLVYWWRIVNNTFIHPDDPWSKFAIGGYGEFQRR